MNPSAIPSNITTPVSAPIPYTPYTSYNQQGNDAITAAQNAQTPSSQPASAVPAQKGNWFTHLLPTIGSVALPALADLVTGGLATPFDIALAGAGSAAGKAGEEATQGEKINPLQVAESAGEGALGQGVGATIGAVGKGIVGKGVDALGNKVAGNTAEVANAADQAAQKAETQRVADTFGGVKSGQGDVGGALSTAKNMGFDKPTANDLVNLGKATTGSNPETGVGAINFFKQQALDKAGGNVDLNNTVQDLEATLKKPEIENQLGSTEPVSSSKGQLPKTPNNTSTQIIKQVRNMLPGDTLDASGQLSRQLTPQEGVSLLSQIGKQVGATSKVTDGLGAVIPEKQAENNVWKGLYNSVKDSVYNRPEVDSAVQDLHIGPDEQGTIDDAIKSNGITDPNQSKALNDHIVNTVNNAQSAQDLLSAEQPFVNVSRVGNAATKDINSDVTSARGVRRVNAGITPDSLGKSGESGGVEGVESAPGKGNALMDTLALGAAPMTHGSSLLGMLPHAVQAVKDPAKLATIDKLVNSGVSKKVASAIPAALEGASQFIAHAGDSQPNAVNLGLGENAMQPQTQTGQNPDDLNSLLLRLAVAESANPTTSSAGSGIINQILPQVQNSNVAQTSLTGAENAFQQAGGGQGGILGNLSKVLGGITGNPASQYEQQRQQLIAQLTPLGIPTSSVPDITGNNASAQNQFQTLQQMINARLTGGSAIPSR